MSPNRLEYSSWAALARCLGPTWDHLGSVSVRFSFKNGTKMASKSAKSLILCQDCSKTEKIEPRLARKFLLGASRAALGRCLGPAWKHLGSILGAFWSNLYAEMEQRWHLTPISPSSYVKTARKLKTIIFQYNLVDFLCSGDARSEGRSILECLQSVLDALEASCRRLETS